MRASTKIKSENPLPRPDPCDNIFCLSCVERKRIEALEPDPPTKRELRIAHDLAEVRLKARARAERLKLRLVN